MKFFIVASLLVFALGTQANSDYDSSNNPVPSTTSEMTDEEYYELVCKNLYKFVSPAAQANAPQLVPNWKVKFSSKFQNPSHRALTENAVEHVIDSLTKKIKKKSRTASGPMFNFEVDGEEVVVHKTKSSFPNYHMFHNFEISMNDSLGKEIKRFLDICEKTTQNSPRPSIRSTASSGDKGQYVQDTLTGEVDRFDTAQSRPDLPQRPSRSNPRASVSEIFSPEY